MTRSRLERTEAVFLDLDGVVWFGDTPAPDAASAVRRLRAAGIRVFFLSNITSSPPAAVARKLTSIGIPASEADVQTPFSILKRHEYLLGNPPILLLGNETVREALQQLGFNLVSDPLSAKVVLLSRDTSTTYGELALASDALQNGARLLALNLDARVPSDGGRLMPGTGAIAALLSYATGVEPAAIGKPAAFFFEAALERFTAQRETTIMVGDTLDSDIQGGNAAGLLTVQAGGDGFSRLEQPPVPDLQVRSLTELADLLLDRAPAA